MRTDAEKIRDIKQANTLAVQIAIAIEGWNEREVPQIVKSGVATNRPLLFADFQRVLNAAFCSTNYLEDK